ncbi:hypothetical protein [Sphingomonas sp.]|uniref:hypothetical protein n=1 Tax=Sphingomonas sp. TaxID=28214 RepID=UPI003AFFB5AF
MNSLWRRRSIWGGGTGSDCARIGKRRVNHAAAALLLLATAGPLTAKRAAIAMFRDWGAFSDEAPGRCFAMAAPPPGTVADPAPAYVAVTSWPNRRVRAQVSALLSHGHRRGAPVTLTIGDSGFAIVADARTAWARDRRQDAEIVAAMRSGSSMSVSTVSPRGHAYADVYRLRGAASAIDAAMLACPPGR